MRRVRLCGQSLPGMNRSDPYTEDAREQDLCDPPRIQANAALASSCFVNKMSKSRNINDYTHIYPLIAPSFGVKLFAEACQMFMNSLQIVVTVYQIANDLSRRRQHLEMDELVFVSITLKN